MGAKKNTQLARGLKSISALYRQNKQSLYRKIVENKISHEEIVEVLQELNTLGEKDFREFVESGGELTKKDRMYKRKIRSFVNVGFDTEDDSQARCHLLVFHYGDSVYSFRDNHSALFWLSFSENDCQSDSIVWCVNTEYDLNNLQEGYQFLIDRFEAKSRFIIGKLNPNPTVKFYDLVNFYSLSAFAVGQLFGLKKLSFDFDKPRRRDKRGYIITTKKELKYCERDAEICQVGGQFITDKFKEWNIAQAGTVASCALQIYLQHYSPLDFSQAPLSRFVIPQHTVYSGYFGGRVEAFWYGKKRSKDIKYYDINSLYPYCMANNLFPNPFAEVKKRRNIDFDCGLVECSVKVPRSIDIPVLPCRDERKVMFPVGRFRGVWTIAELHYAMSLGVKVDKIFSAWSYNTMIDLFSEFIGDLYEKRKNSKTPADSKFFKIIMNGLYGKFAEKRSLNKWVPLEFGDAHASIQYDMSSVTEEYLPLHNNTIISAYVTAYGRMELHKLLMRVIDLGGKVLYCDTDSVIYEGNFTLSESKDLGGLKQEAKIKFVEILGAKYYRFTELNGDKQYVCKGVRKQYQSEMFSKGQATYTRPLRWREAKIRKMKPNTWVEVTKHARQVYDKRIVLESGDTRPLVFNR